MRVILKSKTIASILLCLFSDVLFANEIQNREVADVALPLQVIVNESNKPLVLNGAGVRYKFFFKIYVGALYLPEQERGSQEILNASVPNRMLMHIVYDEVPRKKLVDAWIEGFKNNTEKSEYAGLEQRLMQFNQMFTTLREGDVVLLDYLPERGTRVTIKNEVKGVIAGEDFNQALLSVWLGEDPVTEELKDSLLGISEE